MPPSDERTQRLLAMLLLHSMKGATQQEKAFHLSLAGLSAVEIADLLQTSTQVVHQHLYAARKGRGRRKT
jgi:DNA-directed RNA polymerase specialized sigma24 family protein